MSDVQELLPSTWNSVDADRPDIRDGITPRDIQAAVEQSDMLYDVTVILRSSREETRMAIRRLGLIDQLEQQPDTRGQSLSIGGEEVDV